MAVDNVHAGKDAECPKSLTSNEQASLPENPAATSEVSEEDLNCISGGGILASSLGSFVSQPSRPLASGISISGLASTQGTTPAPDNNGNPTGTGTGGNGVGTL